MDKVKSDMAFAFGQLMSSAKQQSLSSKHYSDPWFQGIARRAKADVSSRSQAEIVSALNAYYTFEMAKLEVAIKNRDYNPENTKTTCSMLNNSST
jgi:hypothetical protein